jgi:hypothetical protein
VASALVGAAADVGSQRFGAAEFAGVVIALLPLSHGEAAIVAALDIVQGVCSQPLSWHARAMLLEDSRCALHDMARRQPTHSDATRLGADARPWLRALHARTLLHTLLRSAGLEVSSRALMLCAERCKRETAPFGLYMLLRCVALAMPRATFTARCSVVVAAAIRLVTLGGAPAEPPPQQQQHAADQFTDEADDQLIGAVFDTLHQIVHSFNKQAPDREAPLAAKLVSSLRALLHKAPDSVTHRRLVDLIDSAEEVVM